MPSPISPKPMIPTFNKLAPRRFGPARAEPALFCHNSYHELGFVSKQTTDILTALADPLGPRGGHMEQVSVSGQVAILTGGARGIGRAACRLLAERGATRAPTSLPSRAWFLRSGHVMRTGACSHPCRHGPSMAAGLASPGLQPRGSTGRGKITPPRCRRRARRPTIMIVLKITSYG